MTDPRRVGLIGLGEVGQVLAHDLHRAAEVEPVRLGPPVCGRGQ